MVKADGSFDSAIINPFGQILALAVSPDGVEATLVSDVPIGTGRPTIAARLGDWVGWISLVAMVIFMLLDGKTKKQAKNISSHNSNLP